MAGFVPFDLPARAFDRAAQNGHEVKTACPGRSQHRTFQIDTQDWRFGHAGKLSARAALWKGAGCEGGHGPISDAAGLRSETGMSEDKFPGWHGTTILAVRRNGRVVVAGDGQVSVGQTVMKGTARKVRRLNPGGHDVVVGFAGSTADAFTLLERLEKKLEAAPGQLARACVDLAKDWRMDKYLRNLEAMLIVTDGKDIFVV